MNTAELPVRVRRMSFLDLEGIFSVDKRIRAAETSATYNDFTTRQLFGMGVEDAGSTERTGILEVARLVDLGFVAEHEGEICGFVVGRQTYLAERDIQEGEIAIVGVDPGYQGKRVATKLVDPICDLFRSRGVPRVRIGVDPLDQDLIAFFQRAGFGGHHLVYYSKVF